MAAAHLTAEQQALVALQQEMAQTRSQLLEVSQKFDSLSNAHQTLQGAHDTLRVDSDRLLRQRQGQIEAIENRLTTLLGKQQCDLLDLKSMKPTVFKGERSEKWKPWARKTKAYCNGKNEGFRAALEWAEKQASEIVNFTGCPWDRAQHNDAKLHDFLSTILGGHAAITADTPGLEGRGFEVWRQLHVQYSPQGATYETDMLQSLMSQAPTRDMNGLADAVVKFEYDWRKYEQ